MINNFDVEQTSVASDRIEKLCFGILNLMGTGLFEALDSNVLDGRNTVICYRSKITHGNAEML